MITRTTALGAIALLAATAALAQTPIPHPRPPIEEIAQTQALNRAQLHGTPSPLVQDSGLRTRNAAYMSPRMRKRSGTAASVRKDGMDAMSRPVSQ